MAEDTSAQIAALYARLEKAEADIRWLLRNAGGAAEGNGNPMLVAATQAVVLAARRVRMLKGGGDTLLVLGERLEVLDELERSAAPQRGPG